jgi:hypothetical protein
VTNFRALLAVGLVVRLAALFLQGTQDMEFWKAWASYAADHGIIGIYGAADAEIIERYKQGEPYEQIVAETQNRIHYDSRNYFRKEFPVVQPPLYVYTLFVAGSAYRMFSSELAQTRWFHFWLNLPPLLASIATAVLIWRFVESRWGRDAAAVGCLLYWCNPVILLNSPIQAYQDPIVAFLVAAAVVALVRDRLTWAFILGTLAVLHKPQGVLVFPLLLWISATRYSLMQNLRAYVAAGLTALVVFSPYILAGRGLSTLVGMSTVHYSSHDLSRQAMNPWWSLQYLLNVSEAAAQGHSSVLRLLPGGQGEWNADRPISAAVQALGFPLEWVGYVALVTTLIFLARWARRVPTADSWRVIPLFALVPYAYYMCRAGVQINHYIILVPLLALVAPSSDRALKLFCAVTALFTIWDMLFYGLGRDFNHGIALLKLLHCGWVTLVLAGLNVALFSRCLRWARGLATSACDRRASLAFSQP